MEFKPFEEFEECCNANAENFAKHLIETIKINDYKNITLTEDDVEMITMSSVFVTKNMLGLFYAWLQSKSGEHIHIVPLEKQK